MALSGFPVIFGLSHNPLPLCGYYRMHKITLFSLSCALCLPSGAAVLWSIGIDDQAQDGNGDPANGLNDVASLNGFDYNVSGVRETGLNDLPGSAVNMGGADGDDGRDIDDDYYFQGTYNSVVDGGTYTPVGIVAASERYYDRALTGGDPNNRWHFNVPLSVGGTDIFTFTIDFYNLSEADAADTSSYDLTFWVDGTQIGGTQSHSDADIAAAQSWDFGLADLGGAAQQGPGFDHYVEVRSSPTGSARWASLDYVQLAVTSGVPEPTSSGFLLLSLVGLGFIRRRK
jgi:hypothetical protein